MENLKLQIIDCVREGEHMALIQLEGVWQNWLATFRAHGNINIRNVYIKSSVLLILFHTFHSQSLTL